MLFLAGDDAGPSDPLTADLTPVFQTLGVLGAIAVALALVVLVARFRARQRDRAFPRVVTVVASAAGIVGFILLVMAIGAGVVVA